jgi:hypothetical protein
MSRGAALGLKLGLSRAHAQRLARLANPAHVQDFIDRIPHNHEPDGDCCRGVAQTLIHNRAHCIEGAFVAACALWMQGMPPLLLDLKADERDDDHVVALFRQRGCWGAISKTNHVWLRWRDPVYRTLRELAMSYIHEYTLRRNKTLRSYSRAFDLRRIDAKRWVSAPEHCWDVADQIDAIRHYRLIGPAQARHLRKRDVVEMRADRLLQYPKPRKRKTAKPAKGH